MKRLVLVGVTIAFVVLVVLASFIANEDLRFEQDADHAVVTRNDAEVPVVVRLSGTEESVSHEVPARSEARLTPPATIGSVREVTVLDGDCVATDVMRFGGGGSAGHWSDLSMLVIQADGSLGFLLPEDMDQWSRTRPSLPTADPRAVVGCVEP